MKDVNTLLTHAVISDSFILVYAQYVIRDRGSTVVKLLCYKSEGRWFDPRWCH